MKFKMLKKIYSNDKIDKIIEDFTHDLEIIEQIQNLCEQFKNRYPFVRQLHRDEEIINNRIKELENDPSSIDKITNDRLIK